MRQPPCEAVSWNADVYERWSDEHCQPPCEAVSWNNIVAAKTAAGIRSASLWGCELKYIIHKSILPVMLSASLWGCELKYFQSPGIRIFYRQPPCEAVSWNNNCCPGICIASKSASLWGCELKFLAWGGNFGNWGVSLLVRLWVEICTWSTIWKSGTRQPPCEAVSWNTIRGSRIIDLLPSASLWGCELKYETTYAVSLADSQPPCEAVSWNDWVRMDRPREWRQPPCEAVSWNIASEMDVDYEELSASLWGCELKWKRLFSWRFRYGSASLWGCELKSAYINSYAPGCDVSLLVRLWVEIEQLAIDEQSKQSASLWGCELKWWSPGHDSESWWSASLWGCELKYVGSQ